MGRIENELGNWTCEIFLGERERIASYPKSANEQGLFCSSRYRVFLERLSNPLLITNASD